ncbi:hypothetical protein HYPBUDRAFT_151750 [Hyphopichia burtonii NRRL Y-1933]|uniref:Uncharacterized protein n=1 Tax=Hyphopichia burtonii NRRL Y-1933 TaxID=984485 RepID=A0A1E4RT10_9ASCO|nr:hypothetical protein HYPBUDRAFT_151750 [Hyphopichia burtonii NRRL Y-1933]ODV70409.1 hypothetical protein HYPBUDRAFT_151750 [Hyphopichia burtonii NRRL Y-1933]
MPREPNLQITGWKSNLQIVGFAAKNGPPQKLALLKIYLQLICNTSLPTESVPNQV